MLNSKVEALYQTLLSVSAWLQLHNVVQISHVNLPLSISTWLQLHFVIQINHAGEGGLYAELLQDRSFDALAMSNDFPNDKETSKEASFPKAQSSASAPSVLTNNAVTYNMNINKTTKMDMLAKMPWAFSYLLFLPAA